MKYTSLLLVISLMLISVTVTYSQVSQTTSENLQSVVKNTPSATVTIKSGGQISILTSKVIELADGDNETAETVVHYLKVELYPPITKIVSDDKYNNYNGKLPEGVMRESEVLEIINQFK